MELKGFYFDFAWEKRSAVISPMAVEKIEQYEMIADTLLRHRRSWHIVQKEEEALEILRFWQQAKNDRVPQKGMTRMLMARALLQKSILMFKSSSPYLIVGLFLALCEEGKGRSALELFLENQKVLSRPMRYSTSVCQDLDFVLQTPSRLCEGIAKSLMCRFQNVLLQFMEEASTRRLVDNKQFAFDLSEMLDSKALELAVDVFRAQQGKYADILQSCLRGMKENDRPPKGIVEDCFAGSSEEALVRGELNKWKRYYDDRNLILQVLSSQVPEHRAAHENILAMGYGHDLECAKAAVRTRKESYRLLDVSLQNHPEIIKLVVESE